MKIRRISQFQRQISFPNFDDHFTNYLDGFYSTDLGKIYQAIPWDKLVKSFCIKRHKKGPDSIFSPRGKVGLMILKNYVGQSDKKLIEQFNGNIYYQIFCDTILSPGESINNYKIVSQIRCELAAELNIKEVESILFGAWKPYMKDLHSISCDATCYESNIRYPTDVKLLFESVEWSWNQVVQICKMNKIRKPRTKIKKWIPRYISYSKMKRKTKSKRRKLTRGLLRLLEKIIGILDQLESQFYLAPNENSRYKRRQETIKKVLEQQGGKFYRGERPKNAIVSIDKPYIRPIVRGKETKSVEFGAKLHKLQIDGISFIEHISYDAFNEGIRLEKTIRRAQDLTHCKVKLIGADSIYATNSNRNYVSRAGIKTDFKPKGRPGKHRKHKEQLAQMITKERASRLEGSFGTDKSYYLLNKIKARTKATETFWIFIGIHTSNALKIGKRMCENLEIAA